MNIPSKVVHLKWADKIWNIGKMFHVSKSFKSYFHISGENSTIVWKNPVAGNIKLIKWKSIKCNIEFGDLTISDQLIHVNDWSQMIIEFDGFSSISRSIEDVNKFISIVNTDETKMWIYIDSTMVNSLYQKRLTFQPNTKFLRLSRFVIGSVNFSEENGFLSKVFNPKVYQEYGSASSINMQAYLNKQRKITIKKLLFDLTKDNIIEDDNLDILEKISKSNNICKIWIKSEWMQMISSLVLKLKGINIKTKLWIRSKEPLDALTIYHIKKNFKDYSIIPF